MARGADADEASGQEEIMLWPTLHHGTSLRDHAAGRAPTYLLRATSDVPAEILPFDSLAVSWDEFGSFCLWFRRRPCRPLSPDSELLDALIVLEYVALDRLFELRLLLICVQCVARKAVTI